MPVSQRALASFMPGRFGPEWVSVATWHNNSCHLDTVLDVVRFLRMCKVRSVKRALRTAARDARWESVRGAIAKHLEQRSTNGGEEVTHDVIDAIHGTVCEGRGQRGEHLNAGENMKVVADKLVLPYAKGWVSQVPRCSNPNCARTGEAEAEHAEWTYPVEAPQVDLRTDEDGGTTVALCLVDIIQGVVGAAQAGRGDLETGRPTVCTSCTSGVVQRCRAVTGEAPEFFVMRAKQTLATPADLHVNFGGKKTLKFPRHQGEEGDPPQGVYRALCRVEHKSKHYTTKVNIGVVLNHTSDEWYSYDALGSPEKVTRAKEEGLASEQSFAVFVNMACVPVEEDVIGETKSLHRVEEYRKSVNAEEKTGSVVVARAGARTRARAGAGKL